MLQYLKTCQVELIGNQIRDSLSVIALTEQVLGGLQETMAETAKVVTRLIFLDHIVCCEHSIM
jgi:hypothetical protein